MKNSKKLANVNNNFSNKNNIKLNIKKKNNF